jgi:hypothetical protein
LFDTAGNEELSVMRDYFIRNGIVLYIWY